MKQEHLWSIAATASFIGSAASFFAHHTGLAALMMANGAFFVVLSLRARRKRLGGG